MRIAHVQRREEVRAHELVPVRGRPPERVPAQERIIAARGGRRRRQQRRPRRRRQRAAAAAAAAAAVAMGECITVRARRRVRWGNA